MAYKRALNFCVGSRVMLTWSAAARYQLSPGPYVITEIEPIPSPHRAFTIRREGQQQPLTRQFLAQHLRFCGPDDPANK